MTHRSFIAAAGLAALFALPPAAPAQVLPEGSAGPVPTLEATRREGDIQIDGRLDEAEWLRARPVRGFIAGEPVEGVPAEHDTEVYVLYDDQAIYIGARMHDSEPETIFRQLTRRDNLERAADYFEISIDSNLDRRTAYTFRISAAGVQEDRLRFDDTSSDGAWDAVWESAAQIDGEGWTAEVRIPLSQLRYSPSAAAQVWGINFARRRNAGAEKSYWALESRVRHGGVSVFGTLEGIRLARATRALELRPYTLARRHTALAAPGDPFFDGSRHELAVGGDIRYGLGSTYVLDLTFNPDFGQVEVDPAVINLTAYETFFPERRPFFSRDDRLFDFGLSGGNNKLFYSRRIGRAPQGRAPAGATFVDLPRETRILGGAKVTGRTPAGLTLGALAAATAGVQGRAVLGQGPGIERFHAEPPAVQGVVRVQQDLREGATLVGGLVSGIRRSLPTDGSLDWLTSEAVNAGVNFEHSWANRSWALWGFLAGSLVQGSPASITRYQRSPNHYYQRPDAHYLEVDTTATSMAGAEWRLQFERRSGRNWTGAIWAAQRTPGFEVDDIGFGRASERLDGGARVSYQEIRPGTVFRNYRLTASTFHNWRHEALDRPFSWSHWWDRSHKAGRFFANANGTFLNYWGINVNAGYGPEYLSDSATRGGPLMLSPASRSLDVRLNTDRRLALSASPQVSFGSDAGGGRSFGVSGSLSWRPTDATEIEIEPSFDFTRDPAQFVTAAPDPAFSPTYGARYVFAEIDRTTLALPMRLNLVFSPTLTLQFFAQPLLSAGDYTTYRQLAAAETFDFLDFTPGTAERTGNVVRCVGGTTCVEGSRRYLDFGAASRDPISFADRDFNVRSLRGNSVLRWEYRPGSILYLVWQQSRLDEENVGGFGVGRDARALFETRPENTLILKVSYWLGL
jgi:hypothetical protein